MANGPLVIDLMHPENTILQLPTAARVGDYGIDTELWIKEDARPKDMSGFQIGLFGKDAKSIVKIIVQDATGRAVQSGRVTFKLPGALFRAAGEYEECWFKVLKDGQAISSVNIRFNVLENNIEFRLPDEPYMTEYEALKKKFSDSINLWQSQVDALITDSNKSLDAIHQDIKTIQNTLDGINEQIKSGNIATKTEIDAAIKTALQNVYSKKEADGRFLMTNVGTVNVDTDWNTINSQGIYTVNSAKGPNCPTGTTPVWGNLVVLKVGETIRQTFLGATTGGVDYIRTYSGSPMTWGPWDNTITSSDIKTINLKPTGGATDPCVMTVIGETLVNLQFNGRYPTKGGQAIYWIDAKYAPKTGVSFAIPHNNVEGTQMVITIGSNGAVILVGNSDDKSTAFGSYAYNCKV